MDPTSRLLRLVGLLQARADWSGDDLAERLGVTTRTLRRDVARMRELGYAVDAIPGRGGGYALARGQALPPLVLDDDEAVAVAVGLRSAAVSGVIGLDEATVTALCKLEGALPSRLRARVSALGADTVHLVAADVRASVEPEILAVLALACHRGERVLLGYRDARGRETRRDVDPYRIVRASSRWYLVTRDVRKDEWRTLRLDRVTDALPVGARVQLGEPPDPATLVAEAVALGAYERRAVVRLDLPVEEARWRVGATTGMVEAHGDGASVLRLGAHDLRWLAHYLVGLHCRFEVLEPAELVDEVRRLGAELTAMAATSPSAGIGAPEASGPAAALGAADAAEPPDAAGTHGTPLPSG